MAFELNRFDISLEPGCDPNPDTVLSTEARDEVDHLFAGVITWQDDAFEAESGAVILRCAMNIDLDVDGSKFDISFDDVEDA